MQEFVCALTAEACVVPQSVDPIVTVPHPPPHFVRESIRNTPCRAKRQQALIALFRREYDGREVLMSPGEWLCLNPAIGLPFRKTLSEMNTESWIKLSSGVPTLVGWIIRGVDDPVDQLMRAYPATFQDFQLVERDAYPHEGWVEVYRRRAGAAAPE